MSASHRHHPPSAGAPANVEGPRFESGINRLLWALVAVGAVLRIVQFAAHRSLWGDEGALALNIIGKSAGDLVGALAFQQGAPTGFLLVEKGVTSVLGDGELSLRLVPLVCGLASLLLFLVIARRTLRPWGAVIALAIFAVSDPLVYYSSEVKQYEVDVAVALALIAVAVTVDWKRLTLLRGTLVAIAGMAAAWLSHAGLIMLAAVAGALLLDALLARDRRPARAIGAVAAIWGMTGLVALVVNKNNTRVVASEALDAEGSGKGRLAPVRDLWHTLPDGVGVARTATALAALIVLAGLLAVWRQERRYALVLVAPIVLALAVSVAGLYPSGARFYLFLAAPLILFLGAGADTLVTATRRGLPLVGEAAVALLLVYPAAVAAKHLVHPPGHEEVRAVLTHVDRNWRPGDTLWIWYQSQYPVRYYEQCDGCGVVHAPLASVLSPRDPFDAPGIFATASDPPSFYVSSASHALYDVARDLAPLAGKKRAWILLSSTWDDAFVRQTLDCMGKRLDERRAERAVAYLYDLSHPSDAPGCRST